MSGSAYVLTEPLPVVGDEDGQPGMAGGQQWVALRRGWMTERRRLVLMRDSAMDGTRTSTARWLLVNRRLSAVSMLLASWGEANTRARGDALIASRWLQRHVAAMVSSGGYVGETLDGLREGSRQIDVVVEAMIDSGSGSAAERASA